jgi:hypothetical protein
VAWHDQFLNFEREIRLDVDGNEHLRKKRKALLDRLAGQTPHPFAYFNQGSYAHGTAIWPLDGDDVDIDVGLVFDIDVDDYDPVEVKRWVLDAVDGHTTRGQEIRRHCVTIHYAEWEAMPPCHVDLAVYGRGYRNSTKLAVGKERTPRHERRWLDSSPRELIDVLRDRYQGPDRDQLRRVVRYLKRWRDIHFDRSGTGAPPGIGLTVAAYHWFEATPNDDLAATAGLVRSMTENFSLGFVGASRLTAALPVAPRNDVFKKMRDGQMEAFKAKLTTLSDRLEKASRSGSRVARGPLVDCFGDDFRL